MSVPARMKRSLEVAAEVGEAAGEVAMMVGACATDVTGLAILPENAQKLMAVETIGEVGLSATGVIV